MVEQAPGHGERARAQPRASDVSGGGRGREVANGAGAYVWYCPVTSAWNALARQATGARGGEEQPPARRRGAPARAKRRPACVVAIAASRADDLVEWERLRVVNLRLLSTWSESLVQCACVL